MSQLSSICVSHSRRKPNSLKLSSGPRYALWCVPVSAPPLTDMKYNSPSLRASCCCCLAHEECLEDISQQQAVTALQGRAES